MRRGQASKMPARSSIAVPEPFFHPGKKMEGYCYFCDAVRSGIYNVGPYPLDSGEEVEGVMRATCDTCGNVIAMAHESVPLIKAALTKGDAPRLKTQRSTVRIPEALEVCSSQLLAKLSAARGRFDLLIKAFMLSYLNSSDKEKSSFRSILRFPHNNMLKARQTVKFHMNFTDDLWEQIEQLRMDTGIENTSEIIRRMLVVLAFGLIVAPDEEQPRDRQKIAKFVKAIGFERQARSLAILGA